MATIQVRDIPDDVYSEIRRQAAAAGQSLQAYMRERVVRETRYAMRRSAVLDGWFEELGKHPNTLTIDDVVDDIRALREGHDER